MTRMLAPTTLLLCLACGLLPGEEVVPMPPAPPAAEPKAPVAPEGPWLFELAQSEGQHCVWSILEPGGKRSTLAEHDHDCPASWSLGLDAQGLPAVGVIGGQIVRRVGRGLQEVPPPPTGTPERAALVDGVLEVATLLEEDHQNLGGPFQYGDRTYQGEGDGIRAFAVRWRQTDTGWEEVGVAETTTGWDLAMGIEALEPSLPKVPLAGKGIREVGKELDLGDLTVGVDPTAAQEGWFLIDTEHGQVATGWFTGEFIHATGPAALKRGDTWAPLPIEASGQAIDVRFAGNLALFAVPHGGPAIWVDLATGKVVAKSEHTVLWFGP